MNKTLSYSLLLAFAVIYTFIRYYNSEQVIDSEEYMRYINQDFYEQYGHFPVLFLLPQRSCQPCLLNDIQTLNKELAGADTQNYRIVLIREPSKPFFADTLLSKYVSYDVFPDSIPLFEGVRLTNPVIIINSDSKEVGEFYKSVTYLYEENRKKYQETIATFLK